MLGRLAFIFQIKGQREGFCLIVLVPNFPTFCEEALESQVCYIVRSQSFTMVLVFLSLNARISLCWFDLLNFPFLAIIHFVLSSICLNFSYNVYSLGARYMYHVFILLKLKPDFWSYLLLAPYVLSFILFKNFSFLDRMNCSFW